MPSSSAAAVKKNVSPRNRARTSPQSPRQLPPSPQREHKTNATSNGSGKKASRAQSITSPKASLCTDKENELTQSFSLRRCCGAVFTIAAFLDSVVAFSSLPMLTLHGDTATFTIYTFVLYQLMFVLPQLVSTLLAERVAKKITGTRAYALTLIGSAASTYLVSLALHTRSLYLYVAARLLSGIVRHTGILGDLAFHELPDDCKWGNMRSAALYGIVAAMPIGGFLGDFASSAATATSALALVEVVAAMAVGAVSSSVAGRPKTVPQTQRVTAYVAWLRRQPLRRLTVCIPRALALLAASMTQCMYPFVDRREFGLRFSFVGLHLMAMISSSLVAPVIVQRHGENGHKDLVNTYAVLLALGSWIALWVESQGEVLLYIFVTLFLIDLPVAVLDVSLGDIALSTFSVAERPFAQKFVQHVKMQIKLWSPVLLTVTHSVFKELQGRTDGVRLISVPAALGVMMFAYQRNIQLTVAAVVIAFALLVCLPFVDDEKMWADALAPVRSFVASAFEQISD